MQQVELFASDNIEYLEKTLNEWLKDHSAEEILEVRFSAQPLMKNDKQFEIIYSACVTYSKGA